MRATNSAEFGHLRSDQAETHKAKAKDYEDDRK